MDERNVFAFLHSIHVDYRKYNKSGKWLNMQCPLAPWYHAKGVDNTPSFGVTVDDEKRSVFKCLGCNQKGRLPRLASLLGRLREKDYSEYMHWAEMTELQVLSARPLRDWDDTFVADVINADDFVPDQTSERQYPRAVGFRYLRQRGVTAIDAVKLGLRYDFFQHRVLFPVYDRERQFRGFTGRSIMHSSMINKGNNPKIRDYFGLDKRKLFLFHKNFPRTIKTHVGFFGRQVIVEGLFGYARMYADGFVNTNASLGTSVTDEKVQELIERGLPVYFFFDNDTAGRDAVFGNRNKETGELEYENGWAYKLYQHIPVWICQYDDGLEGLDPSDITRKQRINAVRNAKLFTDKYLQSIISVW